MSDLTRKEKQWLDKVQKVLDECPSNRIAFYTIGDPTIHAYDVTKYDEITRLMDNRICLDFGPAATTAGAQFEKELIFPQPVESTAG